MISVMNNGFLLFDNADSVIRAIKLSTPELTCLSIPQTRILLDIIPRQNQPDTV